MSSELNFYNGAGKTDAEYKNFQEQIRYLNTGDYYRPEPHSSVYIVVLKQLVAEENGVYTWGIYYVLKPH